MFPCCGQRKAESSQEKVVKARGAYVTNRQFEHTHFLYIGYNKKADVRT